MSTKSTLILGAIAVAGIVATFYEWDRAQRAEVERAALSLERDQLRSRADTDRERAARAARDLAGMEDEVRALKLKVASATVSAPQKPSAPAATAATGGATIGMPVWQIQKNTLNNLRQIDAARKYFKAHKGRRRIRCATWWEPAA